MNAAGPNGVHISPERIYSDVRKLAVTMARIEGKLDGIISDTDDHETRLRMLEKDKWPLPAIGVLSGLAGAATALVALLR